MAYKQEFRHSWLLLPGGQCIKMVMYHDLNKCSVWRAQWLPNGKCVSACDISGWDIFLSLFFIKTSSFLKKKLAWQGFNAMLHLQTCKALHQWWSCSKCSIRTTPNPLSQRHLTYWGSTSGQLWSLSRRGSRRGWGHTRSPPVPCPRAACACPARQKCFWSQCLPGAQMAFDGRPCKQMRRYLETGPDCPPRAQEYLVAAGSQATDVYRGRRDVCLGSRP